MTTLMKTLMKLRWRKVFLKYLIYLSYPYDNLVADGNPSVYINGNPIKNSHDNPYKKNLILKIYVTAFQLFVFDLTRFKQILKNVQTISCKNSHKYNAKILCYYKNQVPHISHLVKSAKFDFVTIQPFIIVLYIKNL